MLEDLKKLALEAIRIKTRIKADTEKLQEIKNQVVEKSKDRNSSYTIKAGKNGYEIEYRANDPKVLESSRSMALDATKQGWLGGGTEKRTEYRHDQYTMDGTRNMGGNVSDEEGKLNAKSAECIAADAGARSQGAMAGSAIATGVAVPAVMNIPYVGWLAAGWVSLLGNNVGSAAGSMVNSAVV